jgi:hypothetical protein
LWRHQPEALDTDVLRLATHRKEPPISSAANLCANPDPGYANVFRPGDRVWAAIYLRDMRPGADLTLSLINPDGDLVVSRSAPSLPDFMGFSAWYTDEVLNERGQWKLRAALDGRAFEHGFFVGGGLGPKTKLHARVEPLRRAVFTGGTAVFDVIIRNASNRWARACSLAPDSALAAVSNYRRLTADGSEGPQSPAFDVAPDSVARFQLTIEPKRGYEARAVKIPLHVFCDNAEGPKPTEGSTIFTLSFQDGPER